MFPVELVVPEKERGRLHHFSSCWPHRQMTPARGDCPAGRFHAKPAKDERENSEMWAEERHTQ